VERIAMGPGLISLVSIDVEIVHIRGSHVDAGTVHIHGSPINVGTVHVHGNMQIGVQIPQKSDGPVMLTWML